MYIDDNERVEHIIEAAEEALGFVRGLRLEDLHTDRKLVLALVKCLEIVGEAAYRLSRNFKDAHPEVAWRELVALRNHLIHEYHEVDTERVWNSVTTDLQQSLPLLRALKGH